MTININLKELWNEQSPEIPDTKVVFEKADRFRKKSLRKLIYTNILLLLTSAFIAFIWYFFQPEMITTKIGIILIILTMIIYLIVYNLMIPMLTNSDYSMNNSQYLNHLLKLKEKQRFLQTTMMNLYFIMLTVGLTLYMFEYASRMKMIWGVVFYIITFLWMLFAFLYLRPKRIRKEEKAINDIIGKFESLNRQLTGE